MVPFKHLTKYNPDSNSIEYIWVNVYNIVLIETKNPKFRVLHFTNNKTLNVVEEHYDIIR